MFECQALETFHFLEEEFCAEMVIAVLIASERLIPLITCNRNHAVEVTAGKTLWHVVFAVTTSKAIRA